MLTNRRQVIQSAAGLAMAGGLTTIATHSVAAQATPATPATGSIDTLRIAMSGLPPQLDPQTDTFIVMVRVYCMVFDTLIQRDWANGGALVPGLATKWTQIDDTTLEFTLRPDVTFQDGSPFTAKDVKFTFERTLQERRPPRRDRALRAQGGRGRR